jgi:hypothetical protein
MKEPATGPHIGRIRPAANRRVQHSQTALMPLEKLNRAFVFLRRSLAGERAEVFSFARSRIFLAGIQPILARFQFPNHYGSLSAFVTATPILHRMRAMHDDRNI